MLTLIPDYTEFPGWGAVFSGDERYETGDATGIQYAKVEGEILIVSEIRPGCGQFCTHPENCECATCLIFPREWETEIDPFTGELVRYEVGPSVGEYCPIPHPRNCDCYRCERDREDDEARSHQMLSEDDL